MLAPARLVGRVSQKAQAKRLILSHIGQFDLDAAVANVKSGLHRRAHVHSGPSYRTAFSSSTAWPSITRQRVKTRCRLHAGYKDR